MPRDAASSVWIVEGGPVREAGPAGAPCAWWSFGKTVLAVCALRLCEEGRLGLDEKAAGRPFTLRQLLQNRAGVPNYGGLREYREAVARGDAPWPRATLLERTGATTLDFEPGAGWGYSNVGFLYVRELVEEASGLGLGAAVEALVAAPLGLRSVRLAASVADFAAARRAPPGYHPGWVYHGCLIGTAADACRLMDGLFSGRLLAPPTLAAMGAAGRAIGHSGAGPGGVAAVYRFPDLARPVTAACFMGGAEEGRAERAVARIARRAAGRGAPAARGRPDRDGRAADEPLRSRANDGKLARGVPRSDGRGARREGGEHR